MRILVTTLLITTIIQNCFAQYKEREEVKYFSRDQIIFDLNYNYWLESESITNFKWNSYGCSFYAMYNLIGKNSNSCFAAGFGISMENINLGSQPVDSLGYTVFKPIPSNVEYTKNKIALTYLDIPVEIRIRTNPNEKRKNFKLYLGGKFGYLLNNHLKYIGDDISTGKWVKYKTYWLPNISKYRYGLTARMGFGKLNISAYYALNTLFEENKAIEIYPINIGFSLFLF